MNSKMNPMKINRLNNKACNHLQAEATSFWETSRSCHFIVFCLINNIGLALSFHMWQRCYVFNPSTSESECTKVRFRFQNVQGFCLHCVFKPKCVFNPSTSESEVQGFCLHCVFNCDQSQVYVFNPSTSESECTRFLSPLCVQL